MLTPVAEFSSNVLTQRNNNQRTGVTNWAGFNKSSFANGNFGKLGAAISVDGSVVAQPLFMESVNFADGKAPGDAIFIATSTNKIYAFDSLPPFGLRWAAPLDLGQPFQIQPNPPAGDKTDEMTCAGGLSDTTELQDRHGDRTKVLGIEGLRSSTLFFIECT